MLSVCRTSLAALLALCPLLVGAQTTVPKLTPAEQCIQDVFRRLAYEHWPRHLLLLDAQATLPALEVEQVRQGVEAALGVQVRSRVADKAFRYAPDAMPGLLQALGTNVAAVVVMLEAPSAVRTPPMLTVTPDAYWAAFSVGDLLGKGLSPAQFHNRVLAQTMRSFGFVLGAGISADPTDVMKPVRTSAELDRATRAFGMESRAPLSATLNRLGLDTGGALRFRRLMVAGLVPPREEKMWPKWEHRHSKKPEELLRALGIRKNDYLATQGAAESERGP
jgi:hypothetical protein